jgi:predicted nucleic acid-binding protein
MRDEAPWVISWQVVQEFCAVALHRFVKPLDEEFLQLFLDRLLAPRCRVYPTPALWRGGLRIRRETQYRFYDSLIVAAALEAGVPVLYSEDLQPGRKLGGLEIRDPFRE